MIMGMYVGIDPGKTGGISILDGNGKTHFAQEMPLTPIGEIDSNRIFEILDKAQDLLQDIPDPDFKIFCVLEKAQSMPKQGVKSTFNYGVGYGEIKAALKIAEIPFQEIPPQKWKKEFNLIKKSKADSCDTAAKLFPHISFLTKRGRMMDGLAESLLLAEYAKRISND